MNRHFYYFYVRILREDGLETSASGEVIAEDYAQAARHIENYHSRVYGKVLSIYIQELSRQICGNALYPEVKYGYA